MSEYSKPKVTIDLEEYLELKGKVNKDKYDSEELAKLVASALLNSVIKFAGSNTFSLNPSYNFGEIANRAIAYLKERGISLSVRLDRIDPFTIITTDQIKFS